jgi:hypothetical protein
MIPVFLAGIGFYELLVILIPTILWVWALIDVLRSNFRDSTSKIVWLIAVIFVPFLGAILYLLFGRRQRVA